MMVEIKMIIHNIPLGIKEGEKPEDDAHQYLVVDDFDVSTGKNGLTISIKKSHIQEYPVKYCVDCLKEGIKNRDAPYGLHSKTENWNRCKDHYAEHMREKNPERVCPECDKGCLIECGLEGEDHCCTHCDYRINVRPTFVMLDPKFTELAGDILFNIENTQGRS